ncbi:MAG: MerR family transcriptional regulator [Lachnospiraceae bacterium]|nr:MerR family transcriptional regulator [Lachnospiraceae bacterium]
MDMIMIKDAAKNLGVESHVLRYWEEELGLEIKRNSMGHRYYDERDIKMFQDVKELRDRGYSLKDIKDGIEKQRQLISKEQEVKTFNDGESKVKAEQNIQGELDKQEQEAETSKLEKAEEGQIGQLKIVDFKTAQLQALMNRIVANALNENKDIITTSIKSELTTDVMRQFDAVMREKEEKEEERYRKLDETLRLLQKNNEEVAATRVKRGLFNRRKK